MRLATRGGFTLVEILIAIVLLAMLMGTVVQVGLSGSRAYNVGSMRAVLEGQLHRTVRRATRELLQAGSSVLLPDPLAPFGSDVLTYQACVGTVAGAPVWGVPLRLAFQYETGELDDGLDNNGNGLIDEGRVVWTEDPGGPGERSFVWCHWVRELLEGEVLNGLDDNGNGLVDERGLCFERDGNKLIVRLTLEQIDSERRVVTRTMQTSTRLRN